MGRAAGDFNSLYFSFTAETGLAGLAIDPEVFLEVSHFAPKVEIVGIGSSAILNSFFENLFDGRVERFGLGGF